MHKWRNLFQDLKTSILYPQLQTRTSKPLLKYFPYMEDTYWYIAGISSIYANRQELFTKEKKKKKWGQYSMAEI